MTGKIINLRQARKSKLRAGKRAAADQNAARYGLTKAEKKRQKSSAEQDRRLIDGHKLEKDEPKK